MCGSYTFTFFISTALMRKSVFDKIGLLDQSLQFSEDVDWLLRTKEARSSIGNIIIPYP